jgi:hypothetical protein
LTRRHRRPLLGASLVSIALAPSAFGQCDPPDQRLTQSDGVGSDKLGVSVAVSGDRLVAGALGEALAGPDSGSALVYRRDAAEWSLEQKLIAADAAPGDFFGRSVAIDADVVVVGADGDDERGLNAGAAYVFRLGPDGAWAQEARLFADDGAAGDSLGWSVSIDGPVIAVGAASKNVAGTWSGAAYVFRHDGSAWKQEQRLAAFDGAPFHFFGESVVVRGDRLIIGAHHAPGAAIDSGAAYVFESAGGQWVFAGKLVVPGAGSGALVARRVALDADRALLSAEGMPAGAGVGAVAVFERAGGSWSFVTAILDPDPTPETTFGFSVALSGSWALAGSLLSPDDEPEDRFARLFRLDAGEWTHRATLAPSQPLPGEAFAFAAAIHGPTAVVGSFHKGVDGALYAYDLSPCEPCPADCNADGAVNIFDFLCFQGLVSQGDQGADCNADGVINIFDFLCFQGVVTQGCE